MDLNVYPAIIARIANNSSPYSLLKVHRLNCLAKQLKAKFPNDPRSEAELRDLICEEYGLESAL